MSRVAVVGLGFTGLPLAIAATKAGHRVVGYDIDKERVDALREGHSYVADISDEEVRIALASGFEVSHSPNVLTGAEIAVICVPTPIDVNHVPDLGPLRGATGDIAATMSPGALVILQSTTYPGTTTEVVAPLLEAVSGLSLGEFLLAYAPERIDPGNPTWHLANTPKIVAGTDQASAEAAAGFYRTFCDEVIVVSSPQVAEAAKLLENTYRQVNIALVNEFAMLCRRLGIDTWEVIEAASTKPFGFTGFRPGPGVGGHCIPIDPQYLSYRARQSGFTSRLVDLAREINSGMPRYVVERSVELLNDGGKPVRGSRVLLLGVAYKSDVADTRGSAAHEVVERLGDLGAVVSYADPHVPEFLGLLAVTDPHAEAARSDLVIVLAAHTAFDLPGIAEVSPRLLDTRGALPSGAAERL